MTKGPKVGSTPPNVFIWNDATQQTDYFVTPPALAPHDFVVINHGHFQHIYNWLCVTAVPNRLYGTRINQEGDAI